MYSLIIHFGITNTNWYRFATYVSFISITVKQHKIPLIVSRQISIANVSPNLTDARMHPVLQTQRGKKRRLDNALASTSKIQSFFVTNTAG